MQSPLRTRAFRLPVFVNPKQFSFEMSVVCLAQQLGVVGQSPRQGVAGMVFLLRSDLPIEPNLEAGRNALNAMQAAFDDLLRSKSILRPMVLEDESTWPVSVVRFIEHERALFDDWHGPASEVREQNRQDGDHSSGPRFSAGKYDEAIDELERLLLPHTLEAGVHCTRLTDPEIEAIRRDGMQLQNAETLRARIRMLAAAGLIDELAADAFSKANSADDSNRAGMIWFCFFPPHRAQESGIGRFFRYWGGEALYLWHERDAARRAILQHIGTPSLVVADVSIACLNRYSSLSTKLIRRYFNNRGGNIREPMDHEGYTKSPVPAAAIRRIVSFTDPEFISLTHCDKWARPLEVARAG